MTSTQKQSNKVPFYNSSLRSTDISHNTPGRFSRKDWGGARAANGRSLLCLTFGRGKGTDRPLCGPERPGASFRSKGRRPLVKPELFRFCSRTDELRCSLVVYSKIFGFTVCVAPLVRVQRVKFHFLIRNSYSGNYDDISRRGKWYFSGMQHLT